MRVSASLFALALFVTTGPGLLAQSSDETTVQQDQTETAVETEEQAAGEETVTEEPAVTTEETVTEEPAVTTESEVVIEQPAVTTEQEEVTIQAVEPRVPGQIVLQSKDSFLASSLLDATVYAPGEGEEEEAGDVEDVIISFDGTITGVVIGIGGFLGIGEKKVAVEIDQLDMRIQEDGATMRIFLDTPKAWLEEAPRFKSVTAQYLEEERARAEAEMQQRGEQTGAVPPVEDSEQPIQQTD